MNPEVFSKFEFSNAIKVMTCIYVRKLKKKNGESPRMNSSGGGCLMNIRNVSLC